MTFKTIALSAAFALMGAAPAAAAAPLAFAPCAEPDQAGWECATLIAPLDHSGATPGTVELRVERLAHDGPPRAKALVNMEGGPGGSTTARSAQTRRLLGAVTARNGYDLVLVDLRATGASRPQKIPLGTSRYYSTADNVRDLELVRQGLGVERLALMGTSYSTLTAAEYARTFPERADRLVLDSPMAPGGPSSFGEETVAAALPALRDVCRHGGCPGGMSGLDADVKSVIARARGGQFMVPHAMVWLNRGRPQREQGEMGIDGLTLLRELLPADETSARFAQLPVALHDAARGDWRALARRSPPAAGPEGTPPINSDLTRITACLDLRPPWAHGADSPVRKAGLSSALAAVPAAAFGPWGKQAQWLMRAVGCSEFPLSGLPGAIKGGPIPSAVPGVILQGAWDLRTPPANGRALAAAWPGGTLVLAPGIGHGVLRSATACATGAVDALLAGRTVDGDACAEARPVAPPLSAGARPADLRPLPNLPRPIALTAAAVVASLRDAEVELAVSAPRGGSGVAAGVADGWATGKRTPPSLATTIRLRRFALQDGLLLDGTLTIRSATAYGANVRLSGRHSGRVKIARGRLRGTIDGSPVAVRLPAALARPAVTRFG
ncbi:alpha/beta hydrolase [Conexibacter sp. JD483]|uniref:alpha/beta fold hydrolase n=1 Tax=unclassified Conexibacter TaxID=2627773 RepID=UPI002728E3B7|nr:MULTISPECIES: alpha/beta hydrolase [unclassified Conexibacter]MDO8184970.1 alpha/beta hydrolase [Conexibacter sp. CPCC 205706]MDO8198114.1 alpha/beta hydrolase [Conexibacter sp. CPCC 205762]MDR9368264.1 alpha/beta hydrolase [Conexibacter sp. JD483]